MSKNKERKRLYNYKELVLLVLEEYFNYKTYEGFTITDISEMIAREVEKIAGLKRGSVEGKEIYSSVHRAVKKLAEEEIIIKNGAYRYLPRNSQTARNKCFEDILEKVEFLRQDIVVVSNKMVAVQVDDASKDLAKELFSKFLADNYFSATILDNTLILILCGNKKECSVLIRDIAGVVREKYIIKQNGTGKRAKRIIKKPYINKKR